MEFLSADSRAHRTTRVAPDLSWGYRTRPTGMSSKERRHDGVFDGCSYQTLRQRVAQALGFTGMTAY